MSIVSSACDDVDLEAATLRANAGQFFRTCPPRIATLATCPARPDTCITAVSLSRQVAP
ncbi:MAG TPA: hypothetical protein VK771_04960 [Acidimicrobiia bacterium]|nr:hypothetical protein [Acidimicrobiia bacterium]